VQALVSKAQSLATERVHLKGLMKKYAGQHVALASLPNVKQ
jgi:hypothetical protein